jgi:hypothetical protein
MAKLVRGRKQRRGLSTIVGAVFMVLIIASALNVTLWTMREQDRVTESLIEKTNSNLSKLSENLSISEVRVDNGKLNVTVSNDGGSAAVLAALYVVNETASPKEQYRYDLDDVVDGRESVYNIGYDGPGFSVENDMEYSIRVVSESGDSVSTKITPLSSIALPMTLVIVPPTATPGTNVTVLFAVTNNLTDSNLPLSITPTLTKSLSCTAGPACQFTDYVSPPPQVITNGATTLFKWVSKVDAPDGTTTTYNASLTNAKSGNYIIERGRIANAIAGGGLADGLIGEDFLYKPEIFPIFPGPFGEVSSNAQRALWGVVIANPTGTTMDVNRIVITMQSPDFQGNQYNLVEPGCLTTPIYPSDAEWSCPTIGALMWRDTGTAEPLLQPYSARAFMVRVPPGGNPVDEQAFIITVTAFTSFGEFSKAGYSGSMRDAGASLGNVYLTTTTTEANAVLSTNMKGNLSGLQSGQPTVIYVAFADLDTSATTAIAAGATLTINIPKGFTVSLNTWSGFNNDPVVTENPDGTSRIVATLTNSLGAVGSAQARVLSFTATPPTVTQNTLFVMHTFVNGDTTHATPFPAYPIGGFALEVSP